MPRISNHAAAIAWLLGISFIVKGIPAFAEQPAIEEVLSVLGMDESQIVELAEGQPVIFALSENSPDEIASGIAWYLPIPLAKVAGHLRADNPDFLDVEIAAHGMLTKRGEADALSSFVLPDEEAEALLDAEPGDKFNLSSHEIESFKTLKQSFNGPPRAVRDAVEQRYREMLFDRFEAYRRAGTHAIVPYARGKNLNSWPSVELRQAASANAILARYLPDLYKAWINYPAPLPPGADEAFPWVEKNVQNRQAAILRHRVNYDWNGGTLVLTREFYASHSYNSSQWITGCMAYRDGTVVFQQVRSYTDQVAGIASDVKHLIGRQLLNDKMLESFNRLCAILGQCR